MYTILCTLSRYDMTFLFVLFHEWIFYFTWNTLVTYILSCNGEYAIKFEFDEWSWEKEDVKLNKQGEEACVIASSLG